MNEKKPNSVGVMIGRIETYELHAGHKYVADTARDNHETHCFVLGTHAYGGVQQDRYPMDIATRELMLKSAYPDAVILSIKDASETVFWSKNLDKLLRDAFPNKEIVLYGSRDSFAKTYFGELEVVVLDEIPDVSATTLRTQCMVPQDSIAFRMACIYQVMTRPGIVFSCVDVVPYRVTWDGIKVLMGGRTNEYGKRRFIGGFSDPKDGGHRNAARRELGKEEAKGVIIGELQMLDSMEVNSAYYRGTRDALVTNIFIAPCFPGKEEPGDDIDFLYWVPLEDVENHLVNEHHPIAERVLSYLKPKNNFLMRLWIIAKLWLDYPQYR